MKTASTEQEPTPKNLIDTTPAERRYLESAEPGATSMSTIALPCLIAGLLAQPADTTTDANQRLAFVRRTLVRIRRFIRG